MKNLLFVLLLISANTFAQDASLLNKLSDTINSAKVLCVGYSRPPEEVRKCTDEATVKATDIFNDLRKQYAKNPGATTALKNFFAASIGAMRMSVSGRSAGDQASIRTEELFWLLKIEAGAI